MAWLQLTLTTKQDYGRQLGDILMANGAQAVTYRDAKDAPIFEPAPGRSAIVGTNVGHWLISC